MTHDPIEELLGANALNAVDDDERAAVDAHLATCPRCRAEVDAHREVASHLALGQLGERRAHLLGDGDVPHLVLDVVAALGGAQEVALLAPAAGGLGPQAVDRSAVALGEQVGAQRAAAGVELLGLLPQAEEDLLHDLLGDGVAGEEAARQAEDGAGVAAVGLGQRLLAVARDGHDDAGVGEAGEVVGSHLGRSTAPVTQLDEPPTR